MKAERALVYPYSRDEVQLFRYSHLVSAFVPVVAVSPPGWGFVGKDVTEIDGGPPSGQRVCGDMSAHVDGVDLIVLASFRNYHGTAGGANETLEVALSKGKPVLLLEPASFRCQTPPGWLAPFRQLRCAELPWKDSCA